MKSLRLQPELHPVSDTCIGCLFISRAQSPPCCFRLLRLHCSEQVRHQYHERGQEAAVVLTDVHPSGLSDLPSGCQDCIGSFLEF